MKAPRFSLARVTIEMTSAFSVGTGRGDDLQDSLFVTDAHGLPAIPGSSLAGLLRASLEGGSEGRRADELFGYQRGASGRPSRVRLSWAQVHDGSDRPVSSRVEVAPTEDAVLRLLRRGVLRDHVRINGRGAVDGRGKFDETLVPAGARFTFELRVDGDTCAVDLDTLLGALSSEGLRVGGRSRRGHGVFTVVRVRRRDFDLSKKADLDAFSALPHAIEANVPATLLPEVTPKKGRVSARCVGHLTLRPEDYWLFGGGDPVRKAHRRGDRAVDMVPKTEARIVWSGAKGAVVEGEQARALVPASSIKGALRHRAAFHAHRLAGRFAGHPEAERTPHEVVELFGAERGEGADDRTGRPGKVWLGDVFLELGRADGPREGHLTHVSLDRFTGGPMDGMLFDEAPLFGGVLRLPVVVDTSATQQARLALKAALDDLCSGRLAVGAGANRGHGYMQGKIEGDELVRWLEAKEAP